MKCMKTTKPKQKGMNEKKLLEIFITIIEEVKVFKMYSYKYGCYNLYI